MIYRPVPDVLFMNSSHHIALDGLENIKVFCYNLILQVLRDSRVPMITESQAAVKVGSLGSHQLVLKMTL